MPRGNIPLLEIKLLFLRSGGVCAFPDCKKALDAPATEKDGIAVLGEIAHIVGSSRQGPRGLSELTDEDRNNYANLILLCSDHHKLIDLQPNTYSIPVLHQMKIDHETQIRHASEARDVEPVGPFKTEVIHSTILPISHLPQSVFTAPCGFSDDQGGELHDAIDYSKCKGQLVPFLLRGKQLFTFHDLRQPDNPFRVVIGTAKPEVLKAEELWTDAEGKRKYVRFSIAVF